MKKLVWTLLLTAATTAAAALASRALESLWRRLLHERPPGGSKWARRFFGKGVARGVSRRLHDPRLELT